MEVVTKLQPTTARRWKHSRSPQCDQEGKGLSRESSTVPVCASQVDTLPRAREEVKGQKVKRLKRLKRLKKKSKKGKKRFKFLKR